MSKVKVFIVGSIGTCQYAHMFRSEGFEKTYNSNEADLVCFTGGSDVSPHLYGEGKHPLTGNSLKRDEVESEWFNVFKAQGIPMVGVCRGGQFLNVMCGGKLYQHVNNHAIGGTHGLLDLPTGKRWEVTSTHHQMMRVGAEGTLIGQSDGTWATVKEYVSEGKVVDDAGYSNVDVEVVAYPESNVLCFQPHPEFEEGECREYFFTLVYKLLGDK
jgi:carbamoylphosphate synthase small subunit